MMGRPPALSRADARFRGNQRKGKLVKRYPGVFCVYLRRVHWPGWFLLRLAQLRAAGPGGPSAGMVDSRAEAMVSRGAVWGARGPGLLALRGASGLGLPADAGRPAPTAFNRAGEKLRAAGGELPRVSGGVGWSPTSWRARSPPPAGGRSWAPVAGAGEMEALVRLPPPDGGGRAGRRRRRRSQRPSWCRGRPWSGSSAATRRRTRPGPWRGAPGLRPRPR